jgi:hypothetical protein
MKLTQHVQWDQWVAVKVTVVARVDADMADQWVEHQLQLAQQLLLSQQHQLFNQ